MGGCKDYSVVFYLPGSCCGAYRRVGQVLATPAKQRLGVYGVLGFAELELYLDLSEVVLFVVFEDEVC